MGSEAQLSICLSSIQPNRSTFLSRNASTAPRSGSKASDGNWNKSQTGGRAAAAGSTNTRDSGRTRSTNTRDSGKSQDHKHKAQWQDQVPLPQHGARGRALCTTECQCEPTLVTPCSVSTPGCKIPQPKLVPGSGCSSPCGSPCSCCHRAPAHSSPLPAGPWAAPAPRRVPRCQGKTFLFFFVIKRLSQKLSADPKRM